jgi:preprotein translocase subunit YajC
MFLHFIAMAQSPSKGTGQGGGGLGILGFLPWIAIIIIFYLLLIRPQARRQKQHQQMLKELKKGDKVVTTGGIHGTIFGFKDNPEVLIVKIADNVKIEVERGSIARMAPGSSESE